jgi:hypothetical protein
MDTLNDYVYDVLESIRPNVKDDEAVDERYIRTLIHNQRELWIRNDNTKGKTIPESVIQDLGCVDIEPAPAVECCNYSSHCQVMRTKLKIPRVITLNNKMALTYVGPLDPGGKPFIVLSQNDTKYFGNGRFSSKGIAIDYRNDYLYLISKNSSLPLMEKISVRGVFVNPEDVGYFTHCTGTPCYNDDMTYPIIGGLWPFMKEHIVKMLIHKYSISEDNSNDGRNEVQAQGRNK